MTSSTSGVIGVDRSSNDTGCEGLLAFLLETNLSRERGTAVQPWTPISLHMFTVVVMIDGDADVNGESASAE
jgi:hypothetical protein